MEFLYNIFIFPIYFLIEIIFWFVYKVMAGNIFISVFAVSFFISIISLPMFINAEKLQKEETEIQKKLEPVVNTIKKNFKGNERFMLLQTYYRQNNYHPVMAFRTSLSLLIQIPFFIAAYIFFSNLIFFEDRSLFLIKNLAEPDGLFSLFSFKINILPIIMTIINIIAAKVYSKNVTTKDKLQMYSIAFIFLLLLYNAPSGLVIYWTFNNIFSLIKNIGLTSKSPKRFLIITLFSMGIIFLLSASFYRFSVIKVIILSAVLIFLITKLIKKDNILNFLDKEPDRKMYLLSVSLYCIWAGVFIPLIITASSPSEFTYLSGNYNPYKFVIYALSYFIGAGLWLGIFYYFSNRRVKNLLLILSVIILSVSVINTLFSIGKLGILPSDLSLYQVADKIIKLNPIVLWALVILLIWKMNKPYFKKALIILFITISVFSVFNIYKIGKEYLFLKNDAKSINETKQYLELSKNGKNVLILMMDALIGVYARQTFEDNEFLRKQFSGFTLYPNCISYYGHTILGYPPIIGGYEYTPYEMDKRINEKTMDKYNEAITVLPLLFKENGYNSLMINPKMSERITKSNGSKLYSSKGINSYMIEDSNIIQKIQSIKQNFFYLDMLIMLPHTFKLDLVKIYTLEKLNGAENVLPPNLKKINYTYDLIEQYKQLISLPSIVRYNNNQNTFTVYHNNIGHLDIYDRDYSEEFFIVNYEAIKTLGNFLDYLKENDIYDNTRIIIVSDHGRHRKKNKYLHEQLTDFNPVLMVKDFNASGDLTQNMEFMTNADVPVLATANLIKEAKNPYTNKYFTETVDKDNIIILTDGTDSMNGTRYSPEDFPGNTCINPNLYTLRVHDNIFDDNNWKPQKGI